jgi:hypothetical protein
MKSLFLALVLPLLAQRFDLPPAAFQATDPRSTVDPGSPPAAVEIVVNHQPGEALAAVALSKLRGIALYSVDVCNASAAPREISGSEVRAAVGRKLNLIAPPLTPYVFQRSREKSKRYWAVRGLEVALLGLNAAMAADLITASVAIRGATAAALPFVDRATHWLDSSGASPAALGPWVEPDTVYVLAPAGARRCAGGLVLGAWPSKTPFVVQIP